MVINYAYNCLHASNGTATIAEITLTIPNKAVATLGSKLDVEKILFE